MTATSPVCAIQYPDLTNVKDQVAQFATMNTNIDNLTIPRFSNATTRDAAYPGTPPEGKIVYLTQEAVFSYYTGTQWVVGATPRTLQKALSEQITAATTVMNADDALYFYAEANSKYTFELLIAPGGSTTVDAVKANWTVPTGASMMRNLIGIGSGQTNRNNCTVSMRSYGATTVHQSGTHSSPGVTPMYWERGLAITGSTPGIFQFNWGKPTAYVETLTVLNTSFLTYRKIS